MRLPVVVTFACVWFASTPCASADPTVAGGDARYRTPPAAVAGILTAPRVPRGAPDVSPDGTRLLLPDQPSLVPIAVLAEPVDKLAGLEVLSALHATRAQLKQAGAGFSIVRVADGRTVRARLPQDTRLGRMAWSAGSDRIACACYETGGAALWIVDAASGEARRIEGVRLNTVITPRLEWTIDGRAVIAATVVPDAALAGNARRVPEGPELRVGAGKATPQRTARDVLRSVEDQRRFAAATRVQLARIPVAGGAPAPLGPPAMVTGWDVAPDERAIVVAEIAETPSGFPWYLFPERVGILDRDGARLATLGEVPLNDRSAISSVAPLGPRGWTWAPDGRSLWFFSWTDAPGADPMRAIRDTALAQPGTDALLRWDAPFTGAPVQVLSSDFQFDGMAWSADGRRLLLEDGYAPRRRVRQSWIDPTAAAPRRVTLVARSTEGVYDDPGSPLTRPAAHGRVLWTTPDDGALYLAGAGFRRDGQRPFLDRMRFADAGTTRVYESDAAHLETAVALLDAGGTRFVTLRQSNREAPNYYARGATAKGAVQLSRFADPAPALTASLRMQFKFMRSDSVWLNAEAVLPADWRPGRRLPTIFWVYPNDYRSAAAASENRRSPNRFPSQSPLNPEVLVTQGYAVVYPDIAVVGTNDRYVEEIQLSARAALDEAVRRGFCDPQRVGVGGHSYGAFSTANLLAHTDLFRAGIASDGAYNRTLTPFTFQAEERTLWEAPETYLKMSPFLAADHIRAPLLLLHNLDDTNVGTNPIQSERMFEALNGLGKVTGLVEYPYEDHAPAGRESVLDYWARVIEWFDRYVKPAGSAGAPAAATPAP